MKNTFIQRCLGISMIAGTVLFGSAFLLRSLNTANAAPPVEQFISEGTSQIGKYMISYSTSEDEKAIHYSLVRWNTETGDAKIFVRSSDDSNGWIGGSGGSGGAGFARVSFTHFSRSDGSVGL